MLGAVTRTTRLRLSRCQQWLGVSMLKEQSASSSERSVGACSVSRMPQHDSRCIVVTEGALSDTSPCARQEWWGVLLTPYGQHRSTTFSKTQDRTRGICLVIIV